VLETCPRKFYWRYVANRGEWTGVKQEFGIIIHEALATHYRGGNILEAFDLGVAGATNAEHPDFVKMLPVWRQRVEEYPKHYKVEEWDVILTPEAELELTFGSHKMYVRLDLIVRSKRTGQVWVVDHKTTVRTGSSWWAQFFVDKQGSGYTLAAEEALGEEVAGWLINVIKPTKTGWFEREAFTRTRAQLESFKRQMVFRLDRLVEELKQIDKDDPLSYDAMLIVDRLFPQHTGSCHGFGTCPYIAACQVGYEQVKTVVEAQFEVRKLSPVDGA